MESRQALSRRREDRLCGPPLMRDPARPVVPAGPEHVCNAGGVAGAPWVGRWAGCVLPCAPGTAHRPAGRAPSKAWPWLRPRGQRGPFPRGRSRSDGRSPFSCGCRAGDALPAGAGRAQGCSPHSSHLRRGHLMSRQPWPTLISRARPIPLGTHQPESPPHSPPWLRRERVANRPGRGAASPL
jgi:hypothetical protein